MPFIDRVKRHARLSRQAGRLGSGETPPFLILFINSICNQACDHCFYWQSLNQRDDLTKDEIFALSDSLGPIENLYLSGGEPFLRPEYAEVCLKFTETNGVRRFYCPTNGSFTEKTITQLEAIFKDDRVECFTVELSLDGMEAFHNEMRKDKNGFAKSMRTYDALAELKAREPRLDIHSISTATAENTDEIKRLSTYLLERCPAMTHHNIAMIRGDRKEPGLGGPALDAYRDLVNYVARLWARREEGRFGGIVEPMLHWGKIEVSRQQTQVVPCKAGIMVGVVHANGDVALCEQHDPIGNLRQNSFPEIWASQPAVALRQSICAKECHCTNEMFLWPSIIFRPQSLTKAYVGARAWKKPQPLGNDEMVPIDPAE
ncbi:MAG: radical SAM protein [Planctomycetes bacterium]|nr:radical SAM protein [Planctomycetota bacterium]